MSKCFYVDHFESFIIYPENLSQKNIFNAPNWREYFLLSFYNRRQKKTWDWVGSMRFAP